jgi:hypothetical protein
MCLFSQAILNLSHLNINAICIVHTILYIILIIFISIKIYIASHYAIFPHFLGFICFFSVLFSHSFILHGASTFEVKLHININQKVEF